VNKASMAGTGGCVRPLEASRYVHPVVMVTNGGIGDYLLAMPALRALAHLFGSQLRIVTVPGVAPVLFGELKVGPVVEMCTRYAQGGGTYLLNPNGAKWKPASFSAAPNPSRGSGAWDFDAPWLANALGSCDLLMVLNPIHSPDTDRLLEILRPQDSVGFAPQFSVGLDARANAHIVDTLFQVPLAFEPSLKCEDFAGPLWVDEPYSRVADAIVAKLPPSAKLLAVHADTKPEKMWPASHFSRVLDSFLTEFPSFRVLLLGTNDVGIAPPQNAERVFRCFPTDLRLALALVSRATAFLGVDSCMLHAADLALIPGVAIFGPTPSARWGYRFSVHRHLQGDGGTSGIAEADVLECLRSIPCMREPDREVLDR